MFLCFATFLLSACDFRTRIRRWCVSSSSSGAGWTGRHCVWTGRHATPILSSAAEPHGDGSRLLAFAWRCISFLFQEVSRPKQCAELCAQTRSCFLVVCTAKQLHKVNILVLYFTSAPFGKFQPSKQQAQRAAICSACSVGGSNNPPPCC